MGISLGLRKYSPKTCCCPQFPGEPMFGRKDKQGNFIHDKCGGILTLPDWITKQIPVSKNMTQGTEGKMNVKEFTKAFDYIIGKCTDTLINRAKRYANDDDRLRNFYNVAKEQNIPVHRIPNLFSAKQREAYNAALMSDIFNGGFTIDMWEEWIVDQINYLILTYAILLNESGRRPNGSADK